MEIFLRGFNPLGFGFDLLDNGRFSRFCCWVFFVYSGGFDFLGFWSLTSLTMHVVLILLVFSASTFVTEDCTRASYGECCFDVCM